MSVSLKVVHLFNRFMPSGMERMMVSAAPYWREHGIRNHLVGQGLRHPYQDELERAGYPTTTLDSFRSWEGWKSLSLTIDELKPDLVHIHTEGAFLPVVLAVKRVAPSMPIVRTIHSIFTPRARALASRRIQGVIADRLVGAFVAPSHAVKENERRFGRQSRIISNWVDDRYHNCLEGPALKDFALIVGNCSPIKNHKLAIAACIRAGMPLAHLGDERDCPADESVLLHQADSKGLLLHRGAADPLDFLSRGPIFMLPSLTEGFSVALAEALAAGVPAIVGPSSGLSWARGFDSVSVCDLRESDWVEALREARAEGGREQATPSVDLAACRGVAEYARLYRELVGPTR